MTAPDEAVVIDRDSIEMLLLSAAVKLLIVINEPKLSEYKLEFRPKRWRP